MFLILSSCITWIKKIVLLTVRSFHRPLFSSRESLTACEACCLPPEFRLWSVLCIAYSLSCLLYLGKPLQGRFQRGGPEEGKTPETALALPLGLKEKFQTHSATTVHIQYSGATIAESRTDNVCQPFFCGGFKHALYNIITVHCKIASRTVHSWMKI